MSKLKNLGFDANFKEMYDPGKAKKLLASKKTIYEAKDFLADIGLKSSVETENISNARCLLTAFIIYNYPNEVLSDIFSPVYFSAKSVVSIYLRLLFEPDNYDLSEQLKSSIKSYLSVFAEWEKEDKRIMINDLLIQYFDLENTLYGLKKKLDDQKSPIDQSDEQQQLIYQRQKSIDKKLIQQLHNRQAVIIKRLDLFKSKNLIDRWKNKAEHDNLSFTNLIYQIKNENETGFEYLGNPLEIVAKSAYWDHLAYDLKNNTNFNIVYTTLEEFKTKMKQLLPNRQDLLRYYDDHIDVEFIKQLVEYKIFKTENLDRLVTFTFEQLKTLDSSVGSKQIDKWMEKWNIIINNYYEISEVLPYVLRDIMNKTERILEVTKYFRERMEQYNKK